MTEDDYDALSQKHLASIKRDMRISLEDAAVRATHKVMAEYETSAQRMKEYGKRTMDKDEALRIALEALKNSWTEPNNEQYEIEKEAIAAIKEALGEIT
jgi:hypothetical protein